MSGLRQLTVAGLFGYKTSLEETQNVDGKLEVYDLFCGAGGFSTGAAAAGCHVAFACDSDENALETHRRNHPTCKHACLTLPSDRIPFPTDGRRFHVHGSPPCQMFSNQCTLSRKPGDRDKPCNLIQWFLETALTCGATSFSMEEVGHPEVVKVVKSVQRRFPGKLAFAVVNFEKLGVPQTRKRLIAGSPELICHLLRKEKTTRRRSVQDAILYPWGTHINNGKNWTDRKLRRNRKPYESKYIYKKAGWTDNCRPVDQPSPTIVATRSQYWVRVHETRHDKKQLEVEESAALQTYPLTYKWPENKSFAVRQIGNSVPPLIAETIMRFYTEDRASQNVDASS